MEFLIRTRKIRIRKNCSSNKINFTMKWTQDILLGGINLSLNFNIINYVFKYLREIRKLLTLVGEIFYITSKTIKIFTCKYSGYLKQKTK